MSSPNEIFNYNDESQSERLARKSRELPLMPVGIVGLILAVGYGAYAYKRRGGMSTSVYLMQLRVAAQGTVVGCLTLGVIYTMAKRFMENGDQTTSK